MTSHHYYIHTLPLLHVAKPSKHNTQTHYKPYNKLHLNNYGIVYSINSIHNGIKHNIHLYLNLIHTHSSHTTTTNPYVQTHPSQRILTRYRPTHHLSYHVCVSIVHVSTNHYINAIVPSQPCVQLATHQKQFNILSCIVHDTMIYDTNVCVFSPTIPSFPHSDPHFHFHSFFVKSLS